MAEPSAAVVARGHEPDRPSLRGIAVAALAILAAILLGVLLAYVLVNTLTPERGQTPPAAPAPIPGAPLLQATPAADRAAFDQEKQRLLHEYAWVDRARGIVRVPIEQAMSLLVQQRARAAGRR